MNVCIMAAIAATLVIPATTVAQNDESNTNQVTDEVVVVGRSIATGSSVVEVARELLVDTATVLKDIPGANVNMNGLITGIAQYRGMYGDRVAVDIDQLGVISGGPNAMDAPLSYVSPMITEKLELSRGIASVSSAPETVGGYISTSLARGDFGEGTFGLSGIIGSRYSNNGSISTSVGRLTLADDSHRFSMLAEIDDGSDIDTPEGELRPTALNRERYDISYAHRSDRARLMLFAGSLDTTDTGTPALPMDIIYIDTTMAGAQLDFDVSADLTVEGRIAYNDVDHMMDNHSLRQPPMPAMYRQNSAQGKGSQFSLTAITDRSAVEWRFGIDGISAAHDSLITNPNNPMFAVTNFADVNRDLLGTFVEWRKSGTAADLEAGLRFNRVKTSAKEVGATGMMGMMAMNVGSLASDFNAADRNLSWNALDAVLKYRRAIDTDTEWTVEIGTKSRAPSHQELYLWLPLQATGGLADGRTYIGNLELKEERSREVVVGITSANGRFGFSPQLFYKRVDDYIQGAPSPNMTANMVSTMMSGLPPLQFSNVDAEIWGLDAAWRFELTEHWLLDGIVSIARGRRTDIDDNLYRLAPYNGSIGLTYTGEDWEFKSELVGYADQDQVSSYNDETPTAGYWLSNLSMTWAPSGALRVEARIDNLFDESYQAHVAGINRAGGSDIAPGVRLFGAGRTVSAGLIYSF